MVDPESTDDLVRDLRTARDWLNGGDCCGQVDSSGTCAAPACVFGTALKYFHMAADEIERLSGEAALADLHAERLGETNKVLFNVNARQGAALRAKGQPGHGA